MPKLSDYRNLIAEIPIGNHTEEVGNDFWLNEFQTANHIQVNAKIFGSNPTARISRSKITTMPNGLEKCALILLWGYTTGMRGNQHKNYLNNLESISKVCSSSPKNWEDFYRAAKQIGNLGISTITKLAYFHGLKFNKNPALILDLQIIKILQKGRWDELKVLSHIKYENAHKHYCSYLQNMEIVASNLKINGAQLEFFLFGMGNVFD